MRRRPLKRFSQKRAVILLLSLVLCILYSLFEKPERISQSCFDMPETAESERGYKDCIRVCTWNVHNYNVSNRRVNGRWLSYPKPEDERKKVADVLSQINADVILLQEMGDMTYLCELKSRLEKNGRNYPFLAVSGNNSPVRLAILSRLKPELFLDFSNIKFKLKGEECFSPRGTLGAKFMLADKELFLFSIHLKSKINAKKKDENFIPFRFAELRAIRKVVATVAKENAFILYAGDFNDEPTKALLRNLGDVAVLQQSDVFGSDKTYYWLKKNILYKYDYFVVSKSLLPFTSKAVVCGHQNGSDHSPVYVDLKL